jgi:uncharacterized membrane protein YhiD involved in acid resistance
MAGFLSWMPAVSARGVDPTRIAAYVVSGIGFLGAGVILRDGIHVRGINTAATIWCSAGVGVLAGAGYLPAAAIAAARPVLWTGSGTACSPDLPTAGNPWLVAGHL